MTLGEPRGGEIAPPRALGAVALAALAACLDSPRFEHAPADTALSVGIVDAGGNLPQSSGAIKLKFTVGTPGPATVVAKRVATPIVVDGDAGEWADVPSSVIPLAGPGAIVGMAAPDFFCAFRTRYSLMTDAFTGAAVCPTPCDPADPPRTEADASAGCTQPVPRFDYGIPQVAVKAAFDDERIYFLLQWADSTEDRSSRPWSYDATKAAWAPQAGVGEDAAFLSFDIAGSFRAHDTVGCAAACHLNADVPAPPPGTSLLPPDYAARFQMHTGADAERIDAWAWRAARTDPFGLADDQFVSSRRVFGDCPNPPACSDDCLLSLPGPACTSTGTSMWNGDAAPLYLAKGAAATGDPDLSPPYLFLPGEGLDGWNPAFEALEVPTSPFPVPAGATATLPGFVLEKPSRLRDDVKAKGRWNDGTWTVELSRALVTDDPNDAQFPLR